MNLPDQEELEAWLAEVELVSEKIKKLATQEVPRSQTSRRLRQPLSRTTKKS